jgi:hypothetical protein
MLNQRNNEPMSSAEIFLLMRLLQHLENRGQLPEEPGMDWQTIYAKLNHSCFKARRTPVTQPA